MVEFFAPWCGHCKALAPEWEKAATALKGVVKVAAVDATAEQSLAQEYGIQGFPTIKVFVNGKATDYQGQRTAQAIVDAGLKAAKDMVKRRLGGGGGGDSGGSSSGGGGGGGGAVIELTEDNFSELVYGSTDVWMVEFFAPWCGHCKKLAPEWREAADQLDGEGIRFGAVDATVHTNLAGEFGVQGYPTIKYFAAGKKSGSFDAQDYQGGRTAGDLVQFASQVLEETGTPPAPIELTSQEVWDEVCDVPSRTCVLAVLPHILDSGKEGREAYLADLTTVVKEKRRLPFKFLWASAGDQPQLEEQMGLTFGFPAAVAINQSKERFARHAGAFDATALGKFLGSMMTGGARTEKLTQAVKVNTVEPWDGEEGVLEEEEDDFDLADLGFDL